jgi:hypothetical protein
MNIVLVCLGNLQEYIFDNIKQLLTLKHQNIYIIITKNLEPHFNIYIENENVNVNVNVKVIIADELYDPREYLNKTCLNKFFRDGFWVLTSLRFFYINELMKRYNITDVIHLENDVLIYYNCNSIINEFNKKYIYMPFDCYNRNISSIMYIPCYEVFNEVLKYYDPNKNDMENFVQIKKKTNLIQTLPIFPNISLDTKTNTFMNTNDEIKFVTNNYDIFHFVFDAAAIGQYIGGVDPRNIHGNSVGFVNETCVIKYNEYKIIWKIQENIKRPFLVINEIDYPIFNLHIHCKDLNKFI